MITRVLVSIVIPIYKTEKYLERCIDSILFQTYENLEIILIEDGSPDNCPQICDDYAMIDSRIKVVHKKNQGLGMARNSGIENATGKYICFFDSDDYIENNTIETLVNVAERNNAEIVCFGFKQLDSKLSCKRIVTAKKNILFRGNKRITNDFIPGMLHSYKKDIEAIGIWMNMWSAMFSLEYIERNNWRCISEKEIISEDIYSLLKLYHKVECVVVIDKVLYNYCDNNNSLSRSFRADRFEKLNDSYEKTLQLCNELSYGNRVCDRLSYPYLDFYFAALKQLTKSKLSPFQKYNCYKKAVTNKVFEKIMRNIELYELSGFKKVFIYLLRHKWFYVTYTLFNLSKYKR